MDEIVRVFSAQGNIRDYMSFNVYEEYLIQFKSKPSNTTFRNDDGSLKMLNYKKFEKYLYDEFKGDVKILHTSNEYVSDLKILNKVYLIDMVGLIVASCEESSHYYTSEELDKLKLRNIKTIIGRIDFLHHSMMNKDDENFKKLSKIINKSNINYNIKRNSIEMVSMSNGNFYAEDFYLKDDFLVWKDPDLHYGNGFEEFHNNLLEKLKTNSKGLTMLHGVPGSGKTQYIRKIISDVSEIGKILYFSPMMVSSITNPDFIDFITNWAKEDDENKKKRYIVIEDAEPLLESREISRNGGITNLLNLTSGLLSDILSIQYICTFNTKISNIDEALLREERLTAIKEFDRLSKDQTMKLTNHIGISEDEVNAYIENKTKKKDGRLTLAEIYSIKNKNEILTHNIITKKGMGFRNE